MDLRGGTKINLHDAVLERIEVVWEQRVCRLFVRPVSSEHKAMVLKFSGVTEVHIPCAGPWGPSTSILEVAESEHSYAITMQSGDFIRINAAELEAEEL